jgi:hypothetical protein
MKLGANLESNAIDIPIFLQSFAYRNLDQSWAWVNASWAGHGRSTVPALYAQDSWEITRRMRANFGLRWEGQFVAGDTGRGLTISNEFAPRVGLVFQPGALGTQKLSLSAGRYYEQLPLWSVSALTMPFTAVFGVYPQNPLLDRSGGNETRLHLGSIAVASRDLKGQHYDEMSVGYERRVGASYTIGVRGTVRVMRWALESDSTSTDPEDPAFTTLGLLGNPGRGALARFPKGTRRYTGLELTFERSAGKLRYLASYVLSRAFGNLPGEFDSDSRVPASHTQGQTSSPNWWEHATGYLPSDRRHLLKLSGSYQARRDVTVGVAAAFGTGLPLSEFAVDPPFGIIHIRDRGTNGRTPSTWNVDLRLAYSVAGSSTRWRPRFVLDLSNLGNQRSAIDFEQLHFVDNTRVNLNPNYLKINKYQAPLSARLGVMFGF